MENVGVRFRLEDFREIFGLLDYNHKDSIDFRKFCLLNTDKLKDVHNHIRQLKYINGEVVDPARKKPPLPTVMVQSYHKKLVLPPKNKDITRFINEVQDLTVRQQRKRKEVKLDKNSFTFGVKSKTEEHDMYALMTNSYANL